MESAIKKSIRQKLTELVVSQGYEPDISIYYDWLQANWWVCLGKALGWGKNDHRREYGTVPVDPAHLRKWLAFIRHLDEGKDADSFFKELLK